MQGRLFIVDAQSIKNTDTAPDRFTINSVQHTVGLNTYALAASTVAHALSRAHKVRRFGRHAGGGIFIGLGIFATLTGTRDTN